MSSISQGLSVIRIPARVQAQLEKSKKIQKVFSRQKVLKLSRAGNHLFPVISCKNKELNFFLGQTYDKFENVPLASKNWNGKKSCGDYFAVNQFGKNPAFDKVEHTSFKDLGLHWKIEERFKELDINTPTNIQSLAIPYLLKGSNTVIAAETGNGKTYTYLAPIIHKLMNCREKEIPGEYEESNAPKALVIVPGRELVIQTRDMARKLAEPFNLRVHSLVGGRTKRMMLHPRQRKTDILISSFGVLSKLVTSGVYNLRQMEHIVLDEADTLLDDSFNHQITLLLSRISIQGKSEDHEFLTTEELTGAQITLAGATFPTSLKTILKDVVEVDSLIHLKTGSLHRLPVHIKHNFYRVRDMDKVDRFMQLAKTNFSKKIPTIIFSNKSTCCDFVSMFLNEHGIDCINLNGAMSFHIRKDKFKSFRDGKFLFLATTDIGSRGLNTTWVEHVINFDCPNFMSDYVHRCGRTGRVGSSLSSTVSTFVSNQPHHIRLVQEIEYAVRKNLDLPNVNANIKRKLVGMADKIEEYRDLNDEISEEEKAEEGKKV